MSRLDSYSCALDPFPCSSLAGVSCEVTQLDLLVDLFVSINKNANRFCSAWLARAVCLTLGYPFLFCCLLLRELFFFCLNQIEEVGKSISFASNRISLTHLLTLVYIINNANPFCSTWPATAVCLTLGYPFIVFCLLLRELVSVSFASNQIEEVSKYINK